MTNHIDNVKPHAVWVAWFKGILKHANKAHGSRPTDAMLTAAVGIANKHRRPGIECLFIAMCLRPEGCTVAQFTSLATSGTGEAVGPANNKRKALVKAKWLAETVSGKPYAYQLALTDKGAAALKAILDSVTAAATPDKPVAVKAAAKAKPVKAKKAKAKPQAPAAAVVTAADNAAAEPAPAPAAAEQPTTADLSALAQHFNG